MDERQREDRARAAALAAMAPRAGAASKSASPLFQAFMSSSPVVASTLMAASVVTMIGWQDMAKRAAEDDSHLAKSSVEAKIRTKRPVFDPGLVEGLPGASQSGPNALEMFRQSNRDGVREDVRRVSQDQAIKEAYEETPEEIATLSASVAAESPEEAALRAMDPFAGEKKETDSPDKKSQKKEKKKIAKAFTRPKISGGSGLAGGSAGGFDLKMSAPPPETKPRQTRTMSAGRTRSVTRGKKSVGGGRSRVQGAAAKLKSMNKAMSSAKSAGAATTASTHNSQWDGSGNIGSSLSGSGASGNAIEGGGQVLDQGGLGDGGPLNPGGGASANSSDPQQAPSVGKGKNVSPGQKLIDMTMILIPVAGALLLGSFLLGKGEATKGAAKGLAYAATAVSAVVAAMGVMIMAKGQGMQGGIIAAVGGALALISYTAAEGNAEAAAGEQAAEQTAVETGAKSQGLFDKIGGTLKKLSESLFGAAG